MSHWLQTELKREKQVIISSALAVDKHRVNLTTLMTALFLDLATERDFKPPPGTEAAGAGGKAEDTATNQALSAARL